MISHDLNITAPLAWQRFYNPKRTRKGSKIFLETLADLLKSGNIFLVREIHILRTVCNVGAFPTVLLPQVFGSNPAILCWHKLVIRFSGKQCCCFKVAPLQTNCQLLVCCHSPCRHFHCSSPSELKEHQNTQMKKYNAFWKKAHLQGDFGLEGFSDKYVNFLKFKTRRRDSWNMLRFAV